MCNCYQQLNDKLDLLLHRAHIDLPTGDVEARTVIRAWLANHNTVHPRQLAYETEHQHNAHAYRQAAFRMYRSGELIKIGEALYRRNDAYCPE